jgi:GNAT superfamily N-acetyltransferase
MAVDSSYQTLTDWQQLDPAVGDAIRAFWISEKASVAGEEADRRLAQVVAHVQDAAGRVVAVATAMPHLSARLGQPMYYYRCFVGEAWRGHSFSRALLRHTQKVLEAYAREHDFPCIGILLELVNAGFARTLQSPHWRFSGFTYIGKSQRGLDLRVWYFRGARLKKPEELRAFPL